MFGSGKFDAPNSKTLEDGRTTQTIWGWIYLFQRQHDKPIYEAEKDIVLSPN